jgi:hypothetical protein
MIGLGMFGLGIRKRRAGVWLAMTLVLGVVATLASTSFALAQLHLRESPPKADFFRFKAKYIVKATGEIVQFDLVRPCHAIYARDMNGDSFGLGPGKYNPESYFGNVGSFPKVTADHHAIVVHIPFACDTVWVGKDGKWVDRVGERDHLMPETTSNGLAPPDLLPFATWFDNADDFSVGWMYATEDAYQSPLAKIQFEGASIENATAAEFDDWQKHAAEGFRPSKLVMHPFGFSEKQIHETDDIPHICEGVSRLSLPPEGRAVAAAAQPASRPRFWRLDASIAEGKKDEAEALHQLMTFDNRKYKFDGFNMAVFGWGVGSAAQSSPTRAHGALYRPHLRPAPMFPAVVIPYGKAFLPPVMPLSDDLHYDVDIRDEMKGFLGCFIQSFPSGQQPWFKAALPLPINRSIVWKLSGQPVAGQPWNLLEAGVGPNQIFENDTSTYGHMAAGL